MKNQRSTSSLKSQQAGQDFGNRNLLFSIRLEQKNVGPLKVAISSSRAVSPAAF
jgi:hypothetical protein